MTDDELETLTELLRAASLLMDFSQLVTEIRDEMKHPTAEISGSYGGWTPLIARMDELLGDS